MRDRREQHDPRSGSTVVLLRQRVLDPLGQLLPERRQSGLARVGLVVAEEREDDVGLRVDAVESVLLIPADRRRLAAEPLVRRAEILGPKTRHHLIAAEAEVADDEVMLRKSRVEPGFEPAVVLQTFRQRVADDRDVIVS